MIIKKEDYTEIKLEPKKKRNVNKSNDNLKNLLALNERLQKENSRLLKLNETILNENIEYFNMSARLLRDSVPC